MKMVTHMKQTKKTGNGVSDKETMLARIVVENDLMLVNNFLSSTDLNHYSETSAFLMDGVKKILVSALHANAWVDSSNVEAVNSVYSSTYYRGQKELRLGLKLFNKTIFGLDVPFSTSKNAEHNLLAMPTSIYDFLIRLREIDGKKVPLRPEDELGLDPPFINTYLLLESNASDLVFEKNDRHDRRNANLLPNKKREIGIVNSSPKIAVPYVKYFNQQYTPFVIQVSNNQYDAKYYHITHGNRMDPYWYVAFNKPLNGIVKDRDEELLSLLGGSVEDVSDLNGFGGMYSAPIVERIIDATLATNIIGLSQKLPPEEMSKENIEHLMVSRNARNTTWVAPQDMYSPPFITPQNYYLYRELLSRIVMGKIHDTNNKHSDGNGLDGRTINKSSVAGKTREIPNTETTRHNDVLTYYNALTLEEATTNIDKQIEKYVKDLSELLNNKQKPKHKQREYRQKQVVRKNNAFNKDVEDENVFSDPLRTTALLQALLHREYLLWAIQTTNALKTFTKRNPKKKTVYIRTTHLPLYAIKEITEYYYSPFMELYRNKALLRYEGAILTTRHKNVVTKMTDTHDEIIDKVSVTLGNTASKTAVVTTTIDTCKEILKDKNSFLKDPSHNPSPIGDVIKNVVGDAFVSIIGYEAYMNPPTNESIMAYTNTNNKNMVKTHYTTKEYTEAVKREFNRRAKKTTETALAIQKLTRTYGPISTHDYFTGEAVQSMEKLEDEQERERYKQRLVGYLAFLGHKLHYLHDEVADVLTAKNILSTLDIMLKEAVRELETLKNRQHTTNNTLGDSNVAGNTGRNKNSDVHSIDIDVVCVTNTLLKGETTLIDEEPPAETMNRLSNTKEHIEAITREAKKTLKAFEKCFSGGNNAQKQPLTKVTRNIDTTLRFLKNRIQQTQTQKQKLSEYLYGVIEDVSKKYDTKQEVARKKAGAVLITPSVVRDKVMFEGKTPLKALDEIKNQVISELSDDQKQYDIDKRPIIEACEFIIAQHNEEQTLQDKLLYGEYLLATHTHRKKAYQDALEKIEQLFLSKYSTNEQESNENKQPPKNKKTPTKTNTNNKNKHHWNVKKRSKPQNPLDWVGYATHKFNQPIIPLYYIDIVTDPVKFIAKTSMKNSYLGNRKKALKRIVKVATITKLLQTRAKTSHEKTRNTTKTGNTIENAEKNSKEEMNGENNPSENKETLAVQNIADYLKNMTTTIENKTLFYDPDASHVLVGDRKKPENIVEEIVNPALLVSKRNIKKMFPDGEYWLPLLKGKVLNSFLATHSYLDMGSIDYFVRKAFGRNKQYTNTNKAMNRSEEAESEKQRRFLRMLPIETLETLLDKKYGMNYLADDFFVTDLLLTIMAKQVSSVYLPEEPFMVGETNAERKPNPVFPNKKLYAPIYEEIVLGKGLVDNNEIYMARKTLVKQQPWEHSTKTRTRKTKIQGKNTTKNKNKTYEQAEMVLAHMLADVCATIPVKNEDSNEKQKVFNYMFKTHSEKYREKLRLHARNPSECTEKLLEQLSSDARNAVKTIHNYLIEKIDEQGNMTSVEKQVYEEMLDMAIKNRTKQKTAKEQ